MKASFTDAPKERGRYESRYAVWGVPYQSPGGAGGLRPAMNCQSPPAARRSHTVLRGFHTKPNRLPLFGFFGEEF